MLFVTIAVTVLPCLLIFFYIYTQDDHPEPKGLVTKVALAGALSSIPVLIFVGLIKPLGLPDDPLQNALYMAFAWAAIPEEFFKLLMVRKVAYTRPEFDEPFDGIIYGAAASLGFAMLENALYVSSTGLHTALLRAITAIPMHLFCGVIMGYYLGRAKFVRPGRVTLHLWLLALLLPILIHGFYDSSIFYAEATGEPVHLLWGVATLLLLIVSGVLLMKRLERRNFQLLSAYYDIPESSFHQHLPRGTHSEERLPQLLAFFREASTSSSGWAAPPDFHQRLEERFGSPTAESSVPLPKRGFWGLLYSLTGILWAGLGILIAVAGVQSLLGQLERSAPKAHGILLLALSGFLLLNGLLLYLKGFYRNRRPLRSRSNLAKTTLFATNLILLFTTFAAVANYAAGENPYAALTVSGVVLLFWALALFSRPRP